jgi:hypothetical protein
MMPDEQALFVDSEAERRTPSQVWAPIRELRADARAVVGRNAAQQKVFGAALQQAEELFAAAGSIGYASKPLPLFYGLSQAGRAIAAALEAPQRRWELVGHGLSAAFGGGLASGTVRPEPGVADSFGVVARLLASPVPAGRVGFARIWSSLPELTRPAALCAGLVKPRRVGWGSESEPMPAWARVPARADLPEDIRPFPSLTDGATNPDAEPFFELVGDEDDPDSLEMVEVEPSGLVLSYRDEGPYTRRLDSVAVEYRRREGAGVSAFFLRPALEDEGEPPSVLMTWWMLLYAVSVCARYHPRIWAQALDVDASPIAVALEQCLDLAVVRVPELIRVALDGPPVASPGGDPPLR